MAERFSRKTSFEGCFGAYAFFESAEFIGSIRISHHGKGWLIQLHFVQLLDNGLRSAVILDKFGIKVVPRNESVL